MQTPATQTVRERFDDRNAVLRAALGLVSYVSKLDRLLERGTDLATTTEASDQPVPGSAADLLVHALLGVISLRVCIGAVLAHMAAGGSAIRASSAGKPTPRSAPLSGRSLLR